MNHIKVLLKLVEQLSLSDHFRDFTLGIIDTHHVIFLLCFKKECLAERF